MKLNFKSIIILLSICFVQYEAKCQWQIVYQDTNLYNMGVQFLNPDTGFVVGITWSSSIVQQGVILRTTNGGLSWDSIYTNSGNFMIEFPSTLIGYAGGHDGSVMKTTDMGDTWFQAQSFCCTDYSNGYFFNNDSGFAILWGGNILKTTNGANSWQSGLSIGGQSSFPGIGSIQFINDSIGIVAAGFNGIYAITSDTGNTWQTSSIDSSMVLTTIYMKDVSNGYAVGYFGKYSRTFDGGNTWTSPTSICSYNLHDIAFFDDSVGYIVGGRNDWINNPGFENGVILKTSDAGNSWTVIDSSYIGYLTSITVVNDSIGYVAGGAGLILKIINANDISGIKPHYEKIQLNIFPNPATDEITIDSFLLSEDYEVSIKNTLGETVLKHREASPKKINIKALNNGIYLLQLVSNQGKIYSKVFIKH